MNFASRRRYASSDQIACLLRLNGCELVGQIPSIPDCPRACRSVVQPLSAWQASRMIDALFSWTLAHSPGA